MSLNEKQKEELKEKLIDELGYLNVTYSNGFKEKLNITSAEENVIADYFISILDTHTTKAVEDKVEEIREEITSLKFEEAPPFSASNQFRQQAELINKHLMPHIVERMLKLPSLINNKQGNE